jgi:hypothetical protein
LIDFLDPFLDLIMIEGLDLSLRRMLQLIFNSFEFLLHTADLLVQDVGIQEVRI